MIILDTNIFSELMKTTPDETVLKWFDRLPPQPVATTAITVAELYYGLASLPKGKRRDGLKKALQMTLTDDLGGLVLPFGEAAAEIYGYLAARLQKTGTPIGQSDTMIAAIILQHGGLLVTRNIRHFKHCKIDVVNPFES